VDPSSVYLSVPEVAELFGLHPESVRKMVREGRLPAFKAGRSWRFDRRELEAWRQRRAPTRAVSGSAPSVLIVDDDLLVCSTLARMVARLGCRARQANDGVRGLELVAEEPPDLILLDLAMPGIDGPRFLERLREGHATLPVVIVTGHPEGELMVRASAFAPVMLLAKPVDRQALERTVQAVLAARTTSRAEPPAPELLHHGGSR